MRLLLAALLALPAPALACRGVAFETAVFLPDLTDAQRAAPVAAGVTVLGRIPEGDGTRTLYAVRVTEPVAGLAEGDELLVAVSHHSCSRDPAPELGSNWYVAGEMHGGALSTEWNPAP